MGISLSVENERLIKLSNSQVDRLFTKMKDLIVLHNLGWNEPIINYVEALDGYLYPQVWGRSLDEVFKNKPQDLVLFISLFEEAYYVLAEGYDEHTKKSIILEAQAMVKKMHHYQKKWSKELELLKNKIKPAI